MDCRLPEELRAGFRKKYEEAVEALPRNFRALGAGGRRVLLAGGGYNGIWIEHNQDNLLLGKEYWDEAWNSQQIFLDGQREDGLIPFSFICRGAGTEGTYNFGQIQSVYPFARCALEVAKRVGRPEESFAAIYECASRFDEWLLKYRNTRGTGLVEMFCEYDTGHDNSPRVSGPGIPRNCPGREAKNLASHPWLPMLSCDLNAMRYGALDALAELAELLGRGKEASLWREKKEELRSLIFRYLYNPEDDFFYDVTPDGKQHFYRTEHITRFFLNHVLSQREFDRIYNRYFTTPGREFRPAYPIPAFSVDDPHFDRACPSNSWASNSQGLTMLRATMWMEYYGRQQDLELFLAGWLGANVRHDGRFTQEVNPFTGVPVGGTEFYTPALLLTIEYARRHPELVE